MKTKKGKQRIKVLGLGLTVLALCLVAIGCGGGGGGTSPAIDAAMDAAGVIMGEIQEGELDLTARAAGRMAECRGKSGVRVYAMPEDTPDDALEPDASQPNSTTDQDGKFVISGVRGGRYILVVDMDGDGRADGLLFDITVRAGATTQAGPKHVDECKKNLDDFKSGKIDRDNCCSNSTGNAGTEDEPVDGSFKDDDSMYQPGKSHKKGTWCDVELDRVIYARGETLIMSLEGNNETDQDMLCGVMINLRKGKDHPEQWRSDFSDAATFITIPANSYNSGAIMKVIPDEWAMTNSKGGSDYQVFPINQDGEFIGKKDNFNILHPCKNNKCDDDEEPQPEPACNADVDCGDGFTCENPGTLDAVCVEIPAPEPACYTDIECAYGEFPMICENPGTADAACVPAPQPEPACNADVDCGDGFTCENPGTQDAVCVEIPAPEPACYTDADCVMGDSQWVCENGGTQDAVCVEPPQPEPACSMDADCGDGYVCENPGTQDAVCVEIPAPEPACYTDIECAYGEFPMICENPGTADAACVPAPQPDPECYTDADCVMGDSQWVCENGGTADAVCVEPPQPEPACYTDADCVMGDTVMVCENAGTLAAACVEDTSSGIACYTNADCPGGGDIIPFCMFPGTEQSYCADGNLL